MKTTAGKVDAVSLLWIPISSARSQGRVDKSRISPARLMNLTREKHERRANWADQPEGEAVRKRSRRNNYNTQIKSKKDRTFLLFTEEVFYC